MRVIVTRPAAQAQPWVDELRARGVEAVALPLIAIGEPAGMQPVLGAWHGLADRALAVFVSPNAVERFFARRPAGAPWPESLRAASPGPGTTAALQRAGVAAACIVEPHADAPQFDSEALWQRLREHDWAGRSVLVVRGDGGREWLADTLIAHGARVDFVAAYRRTAPAFDADDTALAAAALAAPRSHLWLFGSSEAVAHLDDWQPIADWSTASALASHPRIATRARRAGFGTVRECRPPLGAVVACIQSWTP